MAKNVDLKSEKPERTNLAAGVAPKLEAARAAQADRRADRRSRGPEGQGDSGRG